MKTKVYLIVNGHGDVRMTKRWPSLARDELGVALTVTIPDGAFRSPVIDASLTVQESQTIQPSVEVTAAEIEQDAGE